MTGRLLAGDPVTRKYEIWHPESDGGVVLETAQDVQPLIDKATALRNQRSGYKKGSLHHAGYVPQFQIDEWNRKRIPITGELCARWLDDNPAFKTHPGKLSR